MHTLKDKVALITGGSSGIGLATARLMAEEGAHVVIVGRDEQKLEAAANEIGHAAIPIRADASSISGINALIAKVKETYGRIDVLFANAGMSDCPPILETDEPFFDEIMDINVKGVFFLFTKAFPLLAANASVIFTSSVAHNKGRPGDPLYSMTKAAVRSLGRTLAMDEDVLAKKVRVNTVSPGTIQTPLTKQDTSEMDEMINNYVAATVPMQRWGQANEVAKAVVFLASDNSSYMTGSDLLVDGGLAQI
ncbi:glucose 1-dehydrogenase [Spirosoma sp. HMF4905]|uniref:Glucose 1-dehydrogenase n=1 Tax=Spirosoma arboris TaxID=2682092 RepID=A0A7K1SL43_9BACT|nr:glucose 1-dehydrogenase [Spirosoma arboris]MVM34529.1 glucose 1-dehydrogenase [Spirosoma arboris]